MPDSRKKTPNSGTSEVASGWQLEDVIDFEFLLENDHDRPLTELENRDHRILHEQILPRIEHDESSPLTDRRRLFRAWLDARRESFGSEQVLPGELAVASWRVLRKGIALVGMFLGAGAAANLLRYDGQQPVNVAAFLGWLVLLQMVVVLVAAGVFLLRKTRFLATETSVFGSLVRSLWSWMSVRINRQARSRVSASHRTHLAAFLGTTTQRSGLYGEVALWPLTGSLQLFGICFNLGALFTTLALVVFSDRAFGWQSAVDFRPDQVHQLVEILAAPWAWAASNAAPSLEQIEGSRIILKDGIKQLTTGNLVSWWPFLCLSLATYGLLPRMLLWIIARVFGRRALGQLSFNHVTCDRLYERLQTAGLNTSGQGKESKPAPLPSAQFSDVTVSEAEASETAPCPDAVALIAAELRAQIDADRFSELVRERFHLHISRTVEWSDRSSAAQKAIEALLNVPNENGRPPVVLLEEAWQPPIAEKLTGLRSLRQSLGPGAKILVVLVGRPNGARCLTPVRPSDRQVWERQILSLGDPQLRLEPLIANE